MIVTGAGNSINAKISKIESSKIYFTFNHKGEIRNTLLPLDFVEIYVKNYYEHSEVNEYLKGIKAAYPVFRAAVNFVWSYRIARVSSDYSGEMKDYMNGLKSGFSYGIELSGFVSEYIGFGGKFYDARYKNKINSVYVYLPNGTTTMGKISDNISILYIAPFMSTRFFNSNKKNAFFLNMGIGYMGYKDRGILGKENATIKGNTIGLNWDIGYDISLSKSLSLGFQLSFITGVLTKYDMTYGGRTETIELEKGNYESLGRIDLSVGLRFNK